VDPDTFQDYSPPRTSSNTGLIIFLVVAVLGLGTGLAVLFYIKRKRWGIMLLFCPAV